MKISVAQTYPVKGNIEQNIHRHLEFINKAISVKADVIVFPELSITGYEKELAAELATNQDDKRFDIFQDISNKGKIIIGIGAPTRINNDIFISMIIFQPDKERITYSKQYLYHTETGYFQPGNKQVYLELGNNIIAPAICYELSIPEHSENAYKNNVNIYIASVLNSVTGVDNDIKRLSGIAEKYKMNVLMANFTGFSGGYECAGKTSVWNKEGKLTAQLDITKQGLLVLDTETKEVDTVVI